MNVDYNSVRGPISSHWRISEGRFSWTVRVPVGATATLWLPAASAKDVLESAGLRLLRIEDNRAVFSAASGEYNLVSVFRERM